MVHRTALITAGSIAAVVFAGAIAVGANLGILNVADSRPVGKLSASVAPPTIGSKVVRVYAGDKKVTRTQKYIIKKAGTVSVAATRTGLRLVDVTVKPSWRWKLAQTTDAKLIVTFKAHSTTYKFVALLGRHGTILARVDQPITKVVTSASSPAVVAYAPSAAPTPAPAPAAPAPARSGEGSDGGGGEADD